MIRKCKTCDIEREIEEFVKGKGYKFGYSYICKPCERIRTKIRRNKNPEKENLRLRNFYKSRREEDPEYYKKRYQKYKKNIAQNIKKYRKNNPEKLKEWQRNKRNSDSRFSKAHNAINNRVRSGTIIKPEICEKCGMKGKLEGHHPDYDKPKNVIWVCRQCHKDIHREIML